MRAACRTRPQRRNECSAQGTQVSGDVRTKMRAERTAPVVSHRWIGCRDVDFVRAPTQLLLAALGGSIHREQADAIAFLPEEMPPEGSGRRESRGASASLERGRHKRHCASTIGSRGI